MKIFAFGDVHGNMEHKKNIEKSINKYNPDLLICVGDITIFESNIEKEVEFLGSLKKKVLLIPGNHEEDEILFVMSSLYKNIFYLHRNHFRVSDIIFIGYGKGGFSVKDSGFEKYAQDAQHLIKDDDKVVLVTHGPPYGTKLDLLAGEHVGNKSYRKFIDKHNVILGLSGHLHENSGIEDELGKKILANPGPLGKIFYI